MDTQQRPSLAQATWRASVVFGPFVILETTGVVLDFHYNGRPDLDGLQTLELVVPGLGRPIRTLARPVRRVGVFDAFEFLSIRPVDRLSLAEHLDRERRLANLTGANADS